MRSFEELNKGRRTISKLREKEEEDDTKGKPIASVLRIEGEGDVRRAKPAPGQVQSDCLKNKSGSLSCQRENDDDWG